MDKKSYVQVSGPASPQIRRVIQRMSPMDTKDINKVQVEPTGDPGQMGYVTNKPEEQGVIHIPEQNIKKQLQKAQPSVDPLKLKEQEEALVEDVIIPHERAHVEDVIKGEGKFSPGTEQKAQKEEDWKRMQEEYGLSGKGRFAYIIESIDSVSSSLEGKGFIKEATELDIIANSIEKEAYDTMLLNKARQMPELAEHPWVTNILNKTPNQITTGEWADLKDVVDKIQKQYNSGKSMLKGDPTINLQKNVTAMIDSISDSLEYTGMTKEAAELDVVSNTLEKMSGEKPKGEEGDAKERSRPNPVFDHTDTKVKDNEDHFPINDEAHARNALARANQYSEAPEWYDGSLSELKKEVADAVKKAYPDIEVTEESYE